MTKSGQSSNNNTNSLQSGKACPFCQILNGKDTRARQAENQYGFVIRDGFPLTDGHTLVIPKRHIASFFDLTQEERNSLFELIDAQKIELARTYNPDGYNIGINDGSAAGQTVAHLHIHLIPRYHQEDKDPRGGVRWVIPEKADYWSKS